MRLVKYTILDMHLVIICFLGGNNFKTYNAICSPVGGRKVEKMSQMCFCMREIVGTTSCGHICACGKKWWWNWEKSIFELQPTNQVQQNVIIWPNGCDETVPEALKYVAENGVPMGGESKFNSEHLWQLASEIEEAVRNSKTKL